MIGDEGTSNNKINSIKDEIRSGAETAFIDAAYNSNLAVRPQFVSNNPAIPQKVLDVIERDLNACDEFRISVAFIKMAGLTKLLQSLIELEQRNIPGYILTTDYKVFTDPKALKKLAGFKNIHLKIYHVEEHEASGFHTKGYIFHRDGTYQLIIGSSNITQAALTVNTEWNTRIVTSEHGEFTKNVLAEFDTYWNSEKAKTCEEIIEEYSQLFAVREKQRKLSRDSKVTSIEQHNLTPNKMQLDFITNMKKLRAEGKNKALLISATGTGKTYASAFALREENPKRVLFVVHREDIDRQAVESYQDVFGNKPTFGFLTGTKKNFDSDFIFSTILTVSKKEILAHFEPNAFSFIVIDEAHRAGAESYHKLMDYFTPEFWLGMTASPDRTDGYDIYSLFDHNIACEIRLQQAMEADLLCPFNYFGITDIEINGKTVDDFSGELHFNNLVCDDRVSYILKKAEFYGYSGDRAKGLIFCSRKKEGLELARKFRERGVRAEFVCGEDSQKVREDCVKRLVSDTREDYLQYIFTVDIFNEGIDIPEINQIILLRSTQSPIIFIQQLGRGLRKSEGKEYINVIDFIGNYKNNYMIPIALSGDRSYNEDNMREYVSEGMHVIPGKSSVHFDAITRKRIYESIDSAHTGDLRLLIDSYQKLKFKLGRIPAIMDFTDYGEIDITKIFDKCKSYYNFLVRYEKDYKIRLSDREAKVIEFLSCKLAKGKRLDELVLLKKMIKGDERERLYFNAVLQQYKIDADKKECESVVRYLTNLFPKDIDKKKYKDCRFIRVKEDGSFEIDPEFQKMLRNPDFSLMVQELLEFGIARNKECYSDRYSGTSFQLYRKYDYEDVCRLLNWKQNANAQNIGGYFYDKDTKTLPVFINYEKADDAIAYGDKFLSANELIAYSKHPRRVESVDAKHIYKTGPEDKDNKIYLFVRKNKDDKETKEFYFLGEIEAKGKPEPVHMETTNDDAFKIDYWLDVPVKADLYDYIVG